VRGEAVLLATDEVPATNYVLRVGEDEVDMAIIVSTPIERNQQHRLLMGST
jgi:hypothetical protein